VQRQYTYGHTLISQRRRVGDGWESSFYSTDGHGSVRQLTDTAGAVTDTYTYDAFGKLIASTGATPNPYLYTGERFDADLGLYHLRARHYDAERGRFVSVDPYPGQIDEPISLHKYLYAHADPVNLIDPSGLSAMTEYGIKIRLIALRIVSSLRALGRAIACIFIKVASVLASMVGYDEWAQVIDLAASLFLNHCPCKLSRRRTTVLGENMTERVIPFARRTGGRPLPFGTSPEQWDRMTPRQRWRMNDGALRTRIREGDRFRYIGRDPNRPDSARRRFDLTGSELQRLRERGIPYEEVASEVIFCVLGRR
jgi:RHS repeat-associated protein